MDYSKHIQKAEEAARRRNYDFAVQLYQQILELEADQGEARAGLRRALKAREETKKGGKFMKMMKGAGPLTIAKGLAKAGKHDAAAKSVETYLATAPLDVEANMLLGTSLEAAGHFKSSLAVFEFIAEIDPKNAEGLKRAGAMMARTGEAAKALGYYERALEVDPRDRDALKARKDLAAEAALDTARYDTVGHSREQLVDAEETRRLEQSRRIHRTPEELEAELERLEARYAEDPSDVDTMLALAEVHEKRRDPEAALDVLERALTYRQGDRDLEERVGKTRTKALKRALAKAGKDGNQEKADKIEARLQAHEVAEIRRRLAIHPGDAGLRLELGQILLAQGDLDEAAAELQKALSDPRRAIEARLTLARVFEAKGFGDLAAREFEKVLDGMPENDQRRREILYSLAALAESGSDLERAKRLYAQVYEVDVSFRDVAKKMEELR
ncbi:tetratricopeptide repeat protein [Saltatorellus ferox]|uniref:tetratricopeptide repeat protein n=1 Tax=Saltatorellus ferox TaxID=2528018 RepID=UPI003AF38C69